MRWLSVFVAVALAGVGAACGQGVSEDPLADDGTGATAARDSSGSGGVGSSNGSGGTSEPEGKHQGEDCGRASECESGWCLSDVNGTKRCCEGNCSLSGAQCDTTGACVCPEGKEYARNECLLVQGQQCTSYDECASGNCADGRCCDETCDGVCEQCDRSGTCVASTTDDDCKAPASCTGKNLCQLPDGETCGKASDCESDFCKPTANGAPICCESECAGQCQACSSDGTCSDYPARDTSCPKTCPVSTRCLTYVSPAELGLCTGHGECAACETVYTRAGVYCGVGRQCDGQGICELTQRGRVAAGENHTCMINDDANVVCWGDNRFGQLGAVFGLDSVGLDQVPWDVPGREIDFDENVVQVTAGAQHTCVLFDTGAVRCWGTMYDHFLGKLRAIWGTGQYVFVENSLGVPPGAVGLLANYGFIDPLKTGDVILKEPAEQISAAPDGATICALLRSGNVSCWGHNYFGQLGVGDHEIHEPAHVEFLPVVDLDERVVEVRSGFSNTCVLTESGRVNCWGDATYGRLGSGDNDLRDEPGDYVDIGERVIDLAVGFDHTCVLLERGAVRCWGNNHQGQLGYGHTDAIGDNETPAEAAMVPLGENVAAGGDVDLGDTDVVRIVAFPARSAPQLIDHDGDGRIDEQFWDSSPTCALSRGGNVRCWGRNDFGQLGLGHNAAGATEHTPDELAGLWLGDRTYGAFINLGGGVLALSEGGRCALRKPPAEDDPVVTGSLYCWGPNDHGQVGYAGNPNPSLTLSPARMGPVHWWRPLVAQ